MKVVNMKSLKFFKWSFTHSQKRELCLFFYCKTLYFRESIFLHCRDLKLQAKFLSFENQTIIRKLWPFEVAHTSPGPPDLPSREFVGNLCSRKFGVLQYNQRIFVFLCIKRRFLFKATRGGGSVKLISKLTSLVLLEQSQLKPILQ